MSDIINEIKDVMKHTTNGTYIIIEEDHPSLVILAFDEYKKLITQSPATAPKTQMNTATAQKQAPTGKQFKGNIHQSIIDRAKQSMSKAKHQGQRQAQGEENHKGKQQPTPTAHEMPILESVEQQILNDTSNQEFSPAKSE
jgi:hypothetical protein